MGGVVPLEDDRTWTRSLVVLVPEGGDGEGKEE